MASVHQAAAEKRSSMQIDQRAKEQWAVFLLAEGLCFTRANPRCCALPMALFLWIVSAISSLSDEMFIAAASDLADGGIHRFSILTIACFS